METTPLRSKILDTIIRKSTLKQRVFDNTFAAFNELKETLFEMERAAGLEAVEFFDRTGADGVGLAYGIGRFALAADVGVGIALPALLLALDVDHLAGQRLCLLVFQTPTPSAPVRSKNSTASSPAARSKRGNRYA